MIDCKWESPPDDVSLSAESVHVWRVVLAADDALIAHYHSFLTDDEQERASRFHFRRHRDRYIIAHGQLRLILSRYLGHAPADLRFAYSKYDKPSLTAPFSAGSITFNLTHSHHLALIAVGRDRAIGVDIEHVRADRADEDIARRFFSPHEVAALRSVPQEQRKVAFFNCWTRKEAFIKAIGEGLSFPLHYFDVSLRPDEPAALLAIRGDAAAAARWSMTALDVDPDFAAALVVAGTPPTLRCWQAPSTPH